MNKVKLESVDADAACFVCGPLNKIGLQAKFSTDTDTNSSLAQLILNAEYQGWKDIIHGGIVAALLDEACIYACRAKAEQCITAELQVRYRKPVNVGAEVVVRGQLEDFSRKIWIASARLMVGHSIHADATAKIMVLEG